MCFLLCFTCRGCLQRRWNAAITKEPERGTCRRNEGFRSVYYLPMPSEFQKLMELVHQSVSLCQSLSEEEEAARPVSVGPRACTEAHSAHVSLSFHRPMLRFSRIWICFPHETMMMNQMTLRSIYGRSLHFLISLIHLLKN
jgi:hypothetical protein